MIMLHVWRNNITESVIRVMDEISEPIVVKRKKVLRQRDALGAGYVAFKKSADEFN